ncbi:MAG: hypothetical protein M1836_001619 [Candelina mexicana]|nr:MAG: hypothetical protein M1836_001619 [Candelina mexicana]
MTGFNLPSGCEHLEKSHLLNIINVISSSSIKSKVSQVLAVLEGDSSQHAKPTILILKAKSKVAGKLISIVEIAKRQLADNDRAYFQYTSLKPQMLEIAAPVVHGRQERGTKQDAAKEAAKEVEEDECMDDSFEMITEFREKGDGVASRIHDPREPAVKAQVLASDPAGGSKIRAVPLLFIYMSTKCIQEFKGIYGFVHLNLPQDNFPLILLLALLYREQTNV